MGNEMKIEVFPWASVKENLQDIKERQKISREDLKKAVDILKDCLEAY